MTQPIHQRPIIEQLRLHQPHETTGVCSRAISEIERLRRICKLALDILTRMDAETRPNDLAIVSDGEHEALIEQLKAIASN